MSPPYFVVIGPLALGPLAVGLCALGLGPWALDRFSLSLFLLVFFASPSHLLSSVQVAVCLPPFVARPAPCPLVPCPCDLGSKNL